MHSVATQLLGLIDRLVCTPDNLRERLVLWRSDRYPDAHRETQASQTALPNPGPNALSDLKRRFVRRLWKEDAELLTTQAPYIVATTDDRTAVRNDAPQRLIPSRMAKRVIEGFEVVSVQEETREWSVAAAGSRQVAFAGSEKGAPLHRAGETIGIRSKPQFDLLDHEPCELLKDRNFSVARLSRQSIHRAEGSDRMASARREWHTRIKANVGV